MLLNIDKANSSIASLSNSVEQLRTATQEAQASASIAITSVQNLSQSVDHKFADFEKKLQSIGTPSHPRPSAETRASSAPARAGSGPSPSSGVDHIEAVLLGWPSFTRASIATQWINTLLDKVKSLDSSLSTVFRPISGNFCKLGVFRFDSYEDRRDFIGLVRDTPNLLDFRFKGSTHTLYIKASVPKDIAKDTDILRSAVFKCHELLKPTIDTKEQILTCYKTRTLTLFDNPIAYYIGDDNSRLETREGGVFCVDRTAIALLGSENGFNFKCDELIQFLTNKFAGRTIVDK